MEIEENIVVYDNFNKKAIAVASGLPEKLDHLINRIIIKEGYKTYKVEWKVISTNGGNYLGDLYEIDVKGETVKGAKETNIFIKNIIPNVDIKVLSIHKAYINETFAYKELNKVYNELQDEADIPTEERFKMVKSFEECNPEAIILENVCRKGYKTAHRMDVVSLNYAIKAIQQLAKFHALSFVIKERKPIFYNEKIATTETPMIYTENFHNFMKSMCTLCLDYLDDDLRRNMENIFPRLVNKYPQYMQEVSNLSCLCHGDFRPNNMMMKESNGYVIDIITIDFQIMHLGCPLHDFLYFIFTATDTAFRKENFTYLKNLYYDTLSNFLEYFDINSASVYPKEEFEKVLKEREDFGLIVTIIFGPFQFADESDLPDVANDCMDTLSFKIDNKFKDRLRDTIEEFTDLGCLYD